MNLKKILVISILMLLVFLIYLSTVDKKIYYLTLGNKENFNITSSEKNEYGNEVKRYLKKKDLLEKYIDNYANNDQRITDLINDIKDNKQIKINNKVQTLKNALIKSDLVTISIGYNELQSNLLIKNKTSSEIYNYIDELIVDYDNLFNLMREYCKEDIILIGYYTDDIKYQKYVNELNRQVKMIADKYSLIYLEMSENTDLVSSIESIINDNILK